MRKIFTLLNVLLFLIPFSSSGSDKPEKKESIYFPQSQGWNIFSFHDPLSPYDPVTPPILWSTGSDEYYFPTNTGRYTIMDALPEIDPDKPGTYTIELEILATGYWPGQLGFTYGIASYPLLDNLGDLGARSGEWVFRGRDGRIASEGSIVNFGAAFQNVGDLIKMEYNTTTGNLYIYTKRVGAAEYALEGGQAAFTGAFPGEGKKLRFAISGIAWRPAGVKIISASIPNSAPTDIALSTSAINENTAANGAVGTLSTTDPDEGNTFTYSLISGEGDTDNAEFTISGSTLTINSSPDYETKNSYNIRVRTTDQDDLFFEKELAVTINDLDETPQATPPILWSTGSAEYSFPTTLAKFSFIDADTDIDMDKPGIYSIEIEITDEGYWPGQAGFQYGIAAYPLVDAVSFHELGTRGKEWAFQGKTGKTYDENILSNFGTIFQTKGDRIRMEYSTTTHDLNIYCKRGAATEYTLEGGGPAFTDIVPGEGQKLRFAVGGFCFKPNGVKIISASIPNGAPTDIALSTSAIDENAAANSAVGTLSTTDSDAGNTFTYSMVSGEGDTDNAAFTISGTALTINSSADYETKSSYSIRIRTADQDGLFFDKEFTITVNDLLELVNGILYVKKGETGTGSGWADAIGEFADALKAAKAANDATAATVKEIWVAGGTYKPLYSPEDGVNFGTDQGRDNAFLLVKDVKVYGGFAGTESTIGNRDLSIVANKSTLSGDFNGDDVITGSGSTLSITGNTENVYHVVVSSGDAGTALLDGFSIMGGDANVGSSITINSIATFRHSGAGIYNYSSSPVFTNITVSGNQAVNGAGMCNVSSSAVLTNVSLDGNKASSGGGMFNTSSSPVLTNTILRGNYASVGGGMWNTSSSPVLTNTILTGNSAANVGALYNDGSSPLLTNVTISGNTASYYGGSIYNVGSYPDIRNSIIWGNTKTDHSISNIVNNSSTPKYGYSLVQGSSAGWGSFGTDQGNNLDADPLFTDATNGNYTLTEGSPALNKGSNTYFEAGQIPDLSAITTDLTGNSRFAGTVDLGAYERAKKQYVIAFSGLAEGKLSAAYGAADLSPATATPAATVTYSLPADNGVAEITDGKVKILAVGEVVLTASIAENEEYAAISVSKTLKITKAPLTITAKADTKVYNGLPYTGGNGVTYVGFVNSETESVLSGTLSYAGTSQNAKNADDYVITPQGLTSGNYEISFADGTLKITKPTLTITAKADTKVYNGLPYTSGNGVTYVGFVNSETEAVLSGTLSYAGTSQNAKNADDYVITPQGLTSGNYEISFADGNLKITKAPLSVTAKADTKVYDGLAYTGGNGVTYSGFVNSETESVLAGTLAYTGTSQNAKNADDYVITPAGLTSGNYEISFADGTLKITKAPLSVTAKADTKVYDGLAYTGGNGVTYGGFVSSETESVLSGTLTYAGTSQNAKNVSDYVINPQGLTAANYQVTFAAGTLKITKAPLVVTAKDTTKIYDGSAYHGGNGVVYTGFVNGESAATITGEPIYGGDSQAAKAAGTYTISVDVSRIGSGNYSLTSGTDATLTISKKSLVAAAMPVSKVYDGTTTASITFKAPAANAGRVGTDEVSISYTSATYDTKDAGTNKAVTINGLALTGADKENYTLNSFNTTGIITPLDISGSFTAGNKVYDGTTDAVILKRILTPLAADAGKLELTGGTISFGNADTGAGKTVKAAGMTLTGAAAGNYHLSGVAAAAADITARPIAVTAEAKTKVYSDADPGLTYTADDLIPGDSFTGTINRAKGEDAGTYTISQGTLALNSNYDLRFFSADFTILKKDLVIRADDKTKFAGTDNPVLTASYDGFVNGEDERVFSMPPTISTAATTASALGTYPITPGGGVAVNYSFTYVGGTLTIIAGAPASVSFAAATIYENAAPGTFAGTLSSTSGDPDAAFTYTLVSGAGNTDNSLFTISGNEIRTAAPLNYEQKAVYNIRIRSTNQHNFSLDKELTISITDVNEQPAIADIPDQTICYTTAINKLNLSGISGQDAGQSTTVSVSTTNNALFDLLEVSQQGGGSAELSYRLSKDATGTATVNILVQDDGGTANGGVDFIVKSFIVTANPLPVITISSNIGTILSKGETAELTAVSTGSYQWANASGIISGQNTATLTVRPEETTTYTVTVTNANSCPARQEITITVNANYEVVKGTNIVSPNGDGVNDNFIIKNVDMYPSNEVKIFDRAGRLLYSQKNYTDQWNGTLNGDPLAEDTYYYIVDFGLGVRPKKGFITIVKD